VGHNAGSNDLLISDLLRTHETQVWFLAEHLVDTPLVHSEIPITG
jgi:starvation-inducible DNA-binding protein